MVVTLPPPPLETNLRRLLSEISNARGLRDEIILIYFLTKAADGTGQFRIN